jgi:subtilisin-like proprotein convertase family protein
MMMQRVLVLVLISLVCVLSKKNAPSWSGEWGVHVAEGVSTDFLSSLGFTVVKQIGNLQDAYVVKHSEITNTHPDHQIAAVHASLQNHEHVVFTDKMYKKRTSKRSVVSFQDPLFPNQWHLNNTGQLGGTPGQDINVTGVWSLGYTGLGVRIAIVDDGYQYTHPDLAPGYQADSSFNINGDNPDPSPGLWDWHGTSAAGVALAAANNACGIGAAYQASGSGIRLIADMFSDADTAAALHFRNDVNDIYSNSWGPIDDGETLEAPGYFTLAALEDGINNGRGGKGSIFVWAAGNGLQYNDNCNYDGFANHRATIAVGAVGNDGKQSYYSEPCAAMLVTAPSSNRVAGITTTDILGASGYDPSDCTANFGGTSSACPLVAGVIALMLEANSGLTWRDVQYILLSTAEKNDPENADWQTNGAGYHINHNYGFGRVNALAAVQAAKSHNNLHSAKTAMYASVIVNSTIPDDDIYVGVNKSVDVSSDLVVEHVEVTVNIPNFFSAGDLVVILTSPSGTQSVLAQQHGSGYAIFLSLPLLYDEQFLCGPATRGPQITDQAISGKIVIPQPSSFACNTITNCADLDGNIALVDISLACSATQQVFNVQSCGAILALVQDRYSGPPYYLFLDDSYNITIPAVAVTFDVGMLMKDNIEFSGVVEVSVALQYYRANLSYDGWTFSTVRNWGENAKGTWTLQVFDTLTGAEGHFASYDLTIYGTSKPFLLPYWVVGVILAVLVGVIIAVAFTLYIRNKDKSGGYIQVH